MIVMRSGESISVVELILLAAGSASPFSGWWWLMVRRAALGVEWRYLACSNDGQLM
jgi:hypothetical protein